MPRMTHAEAQPEDCWLWVKARSSSGYGSTWHDGKTKSAHRLSHKLATGEDPPCVLHSCDTRSCIRPLHLRGGTHLDNARDASDRGRASAPPVPRPWDYRRGERHPNSKLNEQVVAAMRLLYEGGFSAARIAEFVGVTPSTAYKAIVGTTWAATKGDHVKQ